VATKNYLTTSRIGGEKQNAFCVSKSECQTQDLHAGDEKRENKDKSNPSITRERKKFRVPSLDALCHTLL